MSDTIDENWIKARLKKRGDQARLARAMGLSNDKMSKIMSGERSIQSEELPKLLAFFQETLPGQPKPQPPGFSDRVTPYKAPNADIRAINRMLASPAKTPDTYAVQDAAPAFDLQAGDVLLIDLGAAPTTGNLVVVNEQIGIVGEMQSYVALWADPWLISGVSTGTPRRIQVDQQTAIYGPVVGVLRGARM